LQRQRDQFRRPELACGVSFTGGLRTPLLVQCERLSAKNDFCDAGTHIHKGGGRQPAVGVSNATAIADAFVQRLASARRWSETTVATAMRRISTFRVSVPSTSHGGLTPPALVPTTTTVCRKNDDFCDAETHVHKSGGRQRAVGVSNAIAIADGFVQRPASTRRGF
jgi:hypothetical protein